MELQYLGNTNDNTNISERKSLGMKNLFSSPSNLPDLQNFSHEFDVIKKMIRDLRIDNDRMMKQIRICVKGIALLVSTPEPDLESEQDGITEDIRDGD